MRDRCFLILLGLCLGSFFYFARLLVYPDLNLTYPFPGGDGHDWISNGLFWAGLDVRYTVRPPLLPWILALLHHLHALALFPVVNLAFFHGGILAFFLFFQRRYGGPIALAVASLYLVNASLLLLVMEVGADVLAALLLAAAVFVLVDAEDRPTLYPLAGLLAGLSALSQQAALLLPLPVAVTVMARRRGHLRDSRFWWGAALFALPPTLWFVTKTAYFATPGDVVTRHWGLLGLAPESLPFYRGSMLQWVGWPWLLALVVGTVLFFHGPRRREALLLTSSAVVFMLFFALFYRWQSHRFLVYSVVFLGFPVAEILVRIKKPIWRLLVWATILLGSALSPGIAMPYSVVLRERVSSWPPYLDPSAVRLDDSAVIIHSSGTSPDYQRRLLLQVGNALERRMRLVPEEVLPDHWWGWSRAHFLGRHGSFYQVVRISLPGGLGSAAVVRRRYAEIHPELLDDPPTGPEVRKAEEWCRSVDHLLEFDDDHLAVVLPPSGEAPLWLQLLPFVTRTSSFYVLGAEFGDEILSSSPVEDRVLIGDLEASRVTFLSRRGWVVRETTGSRPMTGP